MATPYVQVNVRLAPALYDRIAEEATKSKRTVTAVVAAALEAAYGKAAA